MSNRVLSAPFRRPFLFFFVVRDQINPSIYFGNPYDPSVFDWQFEQPPLTPEDLEWWTPLFTPDPSTSHPSVPSDPPSKSQVLVESQGQFFETFNLSNGMSPQLSPLELDVVLFDLPEIASEIAGASPQFSEDRGCHCPFFDEFSFGDLLEVPLEEESASSNKSEDD